MNSRIVFPLTSAFIIQLVITIAPPTANAAAFYISPNGSDSHHCTNDSTDACASFPRCAQVMAPGDTCYALDGLYVVQDTDSRFPNQGWLFNSPGGRPGATKRFTSLSQDPARVIIKSARPHEQDTFSLQGAGGTSTQARYLEFDHLTFEGRMDPFVTGGAPLDGFYYHHNVARCPNRGTGGGNHAFIQTIATPTEMHKNIRITENLFLMEESCVALLAPDNPPDWQCNTSPGGTCTLYMIDLYHTNGAVIENNDLVNSSSVNMMALLVLKQGNKDAVVRFNYIRGNGAQDPTGIWINDCDGVERVNEWGDRSNQGGSPRCNNRIYQNVIQDTSGGPQPWDEADMEEWIYNNTIVGSKTRCLGAVVSFTNGAVGHRVFNNICSGSRAPDDGHVAWPGYGRGRTTCIAQQGYFDNNLYWPAGSGAPLWKDCEADSDGDGSLDHRQVYSSFEAWKAHLSSTGHEQHSRVTDPLFVNSQAADYRLQPTSPARHLGRGGSWPSVLGAYVSGSEAIGCTFHSRCHAYGMGSPPTPGRPASVLGVVRTDAH